MKLGRYKVDNGCLLLVLPVLRGAMPWLQVRLHAGIPVVLSAIWIFFNARKPCVIQRHASAKMRNALFFVIFYLIWYLFSPFLYEIIGFGGGSQKGVYPIFATLVIQCFLMISLYFLFIQGKFDEIKFLLIVFLVGVLFTGTKSFVMKDEMLVIGGARALMGAQRSSVKTETFDTAIEAVTSGLGTYGYCYMVAFMGGIFTLILFRKSEMFWKIAAIFGLVGSYFTIKSSGLGTPMFVFVISIVLCIISIIVRRSKVVAGVGILFGLLLMVFAYNPRIFSFVEAPFRALAEMFRESSQLSYRFTAIAEALSGGQKSYASRRYQLQKDSFETFIAPENFFFGAGEYYFEYAYVGNRRIGNHSMICDRLAREGIFGFLPFILFWCLYGEYFKRIPWLRYSKDAQCVFGIFCGSYFFAAVSNPIDFLYPILHLSVPACALLVAEDEMKKQLARGGMRRI